MSCSRCRFILHLQGVLQLMLTMFVIAVLLAVWQHTSSQRGLIGYPSSSNSNTRLPLSNNSRSVFVRRVRSFLQRLGTYRLLIMSRDVRVQTLTLIESVCYTVNCCQLYFVTTFAQELYFLRRSRCFFSRALGFAFSTL